MSATCSSPEGRGGRRRRRPDPLGLIFVAFLANGQFWSPQPGPADLRRRHRPLRPLPVTRGSRVADDVGGADATGDARTAGPRGRHDSRVLGSERVGAAGPLPLPPRTGEGVGAVGMKGPHGRSDRGAVNLRAGAPARRCRQPPPVAVADRRRRPGRPDHGRDAVLPRDDGAVAQDAAASVTTAETVANSGVQGGAVNPPPGHRQGGAGWPRPASGQPAPSR